jgi:hypothetical protein
LILYVNGDSHSAGAEAVNPHAFAEDDPLYWALGRRPHPDNERASYGCELANLMGAILECDAESASSNDRIIRTTYDYLDHVQIVDGAKPDLVVIGWSTWEREEWYDPETEKYWQVNAGGVGNDWPDSIKNRYKDYIANLDIVQSINRAVNNIWALHAELDKQNIKHLFFNTFEPIHSTHKFTNWNGSYLEPYDPKFSYYNWLRDRGHQPVRPDSYHFGPRAHADWAQFLYQTLVTKHLTS